MLQWEDHAASASDQATFNETANHPCASIYIETIHADHIAIAALACQGGAARKAAYIVNCEYPEGFAMTLQQETDVLASLKNIEELLHTLVQYAQSAAIKHEWPHPQSQRPQRPRS